MFDGRRSEATAEVTGFLVQTCLGAGPSDGTKKGAMRLASVASSTRPARAVRVSVIVRLGFEAAQAPVRAPLPGHTHASLMSASGSMDVNAVPLFASLPRAAVQD